MNNYVDQYLHIKKVTHLLGLDNVTLTDNNSAVQLIVFENSKLFQYSPKLPAADLDNFFEEQMSFYLTAAKLFESEIINHQRFTLLPFWDQSNEMLWMHHVFIKDVPYTSKQAIYDAKCNAENKDLSCTCIHIENPKRLIIRIYQKSTFGSMYIPHRYAPFDLHIFTGNSEYHVEGVINKHVNESGPNNSQNIEEFSNKTEGEILFTVTTPRQLNQQLDSYLHQLDLIGIIEN